ncbi:MAG: hypothetical protein EBU93_00480 [Chlamydiae bacterium]|jgi:hypothetical protein|nr:hypothetical protein [Chlamydiota bacterium]
MQLFKKAERRFLLICGMMSGLALFASLFFSSFEHLFLTDQKENSPCCTQTRTQGSKQIFLFQDKKMTAIKLKAPSSQLDFSPHALSSLVESMKDLSLDIKISEGKKIDHYFLKADHGKFHLKEESLHLHKVQLETFTVHPSLLENKKLIQAHAEKIEISLSKKPFHLKAFDLISHVEDPL